MEIDLQEARREIVVSGTRLALCTDCQAKAGEWHMIEHMHGFCL
jgi:hypothetical protein